MMRLARKTMPKVEAQLWVYGELDRTYPPLEKRTMSGAQPPAAEAVAALLEELRAGS